MSPNEHQLENEVLENLLGLNYLYPADIRVTPDVFTTYHTLCHRNPVRRSS